jgi:flagellar motor component MotA
MDILTLTGLVVAFGGIIGGMLIEGGHISSLINGPAFLIVVGGTIGAVLIQMPMDVFKRALGAVKWALCRPTVAMESAIEKIVEWSNIARKEGLLRLEDHIQQEPDPFASKALQLLVDGKEPEEIRHILELDMSIREEMTCRRSVLRRRWRLRAHHRHHRRRAGPDPCHGQSGRSQQTRRRYRRRVRRHHLRPGAGQRLRPADGQ